MSVPSTSPIPSETSLTLILHPGFLFLPLYIVLNSPVFLSASALLSLVPAEQYSASQYPAALPRFLYSVFAAKALDVCVREMPNWALSEQCTSCDSAQS